MTGIALTVEVHDIQELFEILCDVPFEDDGSFERPAAIESLISQIESFLILDDELNPSQEEDDSDKHAED